MIKHRGCNEQVRERVSEDPGLVGTTTQLERELILHIRWLYRFEDLQG
jgi:hypothetical protein